MQKLKTKSVFIHVVEYYKDNTMVKCENITEIQKEGISNYWKILKDLFSKADNKFVEMDNFCMVTKCVRDYDYQVNKIVESIQIDNN